MGSVLRECIRTLLESSNSWHRISEKSIRLRQLFQVDPAAAEAYRRQFRWDELLKHALSRPESYELRPADVEFLKDRMNDPGEVPAFGGVGVFFYQIPEGWLAFYDAGPGEGDDLMLFETSSGKWVGTGSTDGVPKMSRDQRDIVRSYIDEFVPSGWWKRTLQDPDL